MDEQRGITRERFVDVIRRLHNFALLFRLKLGILSAMAIYQQQRFRVGN
jgi:hypothetical protein